VKGYKGKFCNSACEGSAADKAKFCTSKTDKYDNHMDAWGKTYKETKLCVPGIAKLISMANLNAKCKSGPITSFTLKADDCTVPGGYIGTGATKDTLTPAAGFFCYTAAGIAWAKNDPIIKNMDGEKFEILSTGTFMLLSLRVRESQKTNLEVLSTIDRAGTRCGATYIQNITLQGTWVEEEGVPQIQVRAKPAVPKSEALQVNFDGTWQPANSHWSYNSVEKVSKTQFTLNLKGVKTFVTVDSHRIHEAGVKTKRFANFLNVNFDGIFRFPGMTVRGLLGRDSHADAAQLPAECASSTLLLSTDDKMLSSSTLA